jgi:hypothetical protein
MATSLSSETPLVRPLAAGALFAFVIVGIVGAVGALTLLQQSRHKLAGDPAGAAETLTVTWPAPTGDAGPGEPYRPASLELVSSETFSLEVANGGAESPGEARIPWTLFLLPESPGGEEYVLSGTMEPPAGVAPDQKLRLVVYYTDADGNAPEWMDPTGLVRTPQVIPTRVASQVLYYLSPAGVGEAADLELADVREVALAADRAPLAQVQPAHAPAPVASPGCFGGLEVGL